MACKPVKMLFLVLIVLMPVKLCFCQDSDTPANPPSTGVPSLGDLMTVVDKATDDADSNVTDLKRLAGL